MSWITTHKAIEYLYEALDGEESGWQRIMSAMYEIISQPLSAESETLLLDILVSPSKLKLSSDSEPPHSTSPEDMLKSLAVQALGRWTGLKCIKEMQKLQAATESPSLASMVSDVIEKAGGES